MKQFQYPLAAFVLFCIIWFVKSFVLDEISWRILDVLSYLLLPTALLLAISKLQSRPRQYWALLLLLSGYGISSALSGYTALRDYLRLHSLEDIPYLGQTEWVRLSVVLCWCIALILLGIFTLMLIFKRKHILKNKGNKSAVVNIAIALACVLYLLSYPYFEAHYGWDGMHGHALWQSGDHLH